MAWKLRRVFLIAYDVRLGTDLRIGSGCAGLSNGIRSRLPEPIIRRRMRVRCRKKSRAYIYIYRSNQRMPPVGLNLTVFSFDT